MNTKLYIYNIGSHTLHISGFCIHAHAVPNDPHFKFFATEDEAVKSERRSLRICELCSERRDKILARIDISKYN